jgi:two-component system cell cycle response regulator
LSEPEDIFRGLEVKADNYLTKPYDEDVLYSRIEHVLANRALRGRHHRAKGVEVIYSRRRHRIDNDREQILELLMSSLDNALHRYAKLEARVEELESERRQLREEIRRLRGDE